MYLLCAFITLITLGALAGAQDVSSTRALRYTPAKSLFFTPPNTALTTVTASAQSSSGLSAVSASAPNNIGGSTAPQLGPSTAFAPVSGPPFSTIPPASGTTFPAVVSNPPVVSSPPPSSADLPGSNAQPVSTAPITASPVVISSRAQSPVDDLSSKAPWSPNPNLPSTAANQPSASSVFGSKPLQLPSSPIPNQSQTPFGTVPGVSLFPPTAAADSESTTALNEAPTHVQIVFNNTYSSTVPKGSDMAVYLSTFTRLIGRACAVSSDRVTDLVAVPQPVTDKFVLRFTLLPISSALNCTWSSDGCGGSIRDALNYIRTTISSGGLQLYDVHSQMIIADAPNQSTSTCVAWTDYGACPTAVCSGSTPICNYTVDNVFYCTQVAQSTGSRLMYLLFLLFLIPIIILIIVVVCVVGARRRKKAAEERNKSKRMVRTDMLSYHEYTIREKELQPKINNSTIASRSTINPETMNTLYRSLGANLSIAYNGSTFIADSGGTEPIDNSEMIDSSSGVAIIQLNDDD